MVFSLINHIRSTRSYESFQFFIRPLPFLFFDQSSSTAAIAKDTSMAVMLSFYIVFCYTCGVRDVMWVPACVGTANISPTSFQDVLTFILHFHRRGCLQCLLEERYWDENLGPFARMYLWLAALTHVSWPQQSACSSSLPQPLLLSLGALGEISAMTGTWAYTFHPLSDNCHCCSRAWCKSLGLELRLLSLSSLAVACNAWSNFCTSLFSFLKIGYFIFVILNYSLH